MSVAEPLFREAGEPSGPVVREKREVPEVNLVRRLFAEAFGTFALVLIAAGGEVIASVSHGEVGPAAKAVAPGLMVMALVYALGDVSGAHINPAVTLAFASRGVFTWIWVPAYWAAQVVGAIAAAVTLRITFGNVADLGANHVQFGVSRALAMEILLSLLLVMVILNTATRARVLGPNAAIAVGVTIALCGLIGAPISGASMNPARSLGPAAVAGAWTDAWIYVIGPLIGALTAVAITHLMHPVRRETEVEVAEGDDS